MYKLYCDNKDITDYVSSLEMTDDMDAISTELSFNVVFNPKDIYLAPPAVEPGSKLRLMSDSTELFRGIVIERSLTGNVKANDYGFYLNKQEIIFQCSKASADNAIRSLCSKCGVAVGSICSIPTKITKVWIGSTPDAILKEILEQATANQGKNYLYRVEMGKLNVRQYPSTIITATYHQKKGKSFDITWALGSVSGTRSISELRNKVIAVNGSDSKYKILSTAQNEASQKKYGTLATVLEIEDSNKKSAATMAKTKLKELNAVTYEYSIDEMLGSDDVKSGVMLSFSSGNYGVSGKYLVKSVTHKYGSTEQEGHTMSLTIKKTVM